MCAILATSSDVVLSYMFPVHPGVLLSRCHETFLLCHVEESRLVGYSFFLCRRVRISLRSLPLSNHSVHFVPMWDRVPIKLTEHRLHPCLMFCNLQFVVASRY